MGASLRAIVKVNLTLHVGTVRPNGYHPVSSICAFPDIGDEVALGGRDADFSLTVTGAEAAGLQGLDPAANLVLRAARLLAARTRLAPRRLFLNKSVPAAAGIAGGTADAAAALVLLNREAAMPLADDALIALSRQLGADGPVCTAGRLAGGGLWLAQGDGDRVSRLVGPPPVWMALANDRVPVSTKRVFAAFDQAGKAGVLDQPFADLRTQNGLVSAAARGRNDLRPAALGIAFGISALEARMRGLPGCRFARMSGSGGSVFGLFASRVAAERAARRLSAGGDWARAGRILR